MNFSRSGIALVFLLVPLAGCVTRSDHAMLVDGKRRTYDLHVPACYQPETPMPLVLALHPFTATGRSFAWMTGLDSLAEDEGFIAVFPDGRMRRWLAITDDEQDVRFLQKLLDKLSAEFAVDTSRVFVTGASNGAHMTYRMLCEDASRFRAAAVVMGAQMVEKFNDCSKAGPVPLLMIHGTRDRVLPWKGRRWPRNEPLLSMERSVEIWRARNGCGGNGNETVLHDTAKNDGTRAVCTRYEGEAPLMVCRVEGGGHTWPGGVDNYPAWVVGKTSRDFNASQVIWKFFEEVSGE